MVDFFKQSKWIILAGALFGCLGALAVNLGNPSNMGICVACFMRDIAGGLKLQNAAVVQYLRPEIMGFVLGAFITALAFKEWKPRGGSSPIIRFVIGVFIMFGALVYLGCPVRMMLRMGGGDLSAFIALAGLVCGILIGVFFVKKGFSLGRAHEVSKVAGSIMPIIMLVLLVLVAFAPSFIAFSQSGPGSLHPSWIISLLLGAVVGFATQRTRFCSIGGWRDIFLAKDFYLFSGVIAFILGCLITNLILGNFGEGGVVINSVDVAYKAGIHGQPIALPYKDVADATNWFGTAAAQYVFSFLGFLLVGLGCTQLGGCPLRNLILSGEGDTDAAIAVFGMVIGGAFAHNFSIASSGSGMAAMGPIAVLIGIAVCLVLGFVCRDND
jgi:YedE family putative selenium metabolism protein